QAHGGTVGGRSGWHNEIGDALGTAVARQWCRVDERILAAAERLRGVQIECRPAEDLIAAYSRSGAAARTLIYADPPYLID
ncbi:hypothetical protein NL523_28805, partial [Klebsiella pneumoniae]|nr:hypothetical protein [Klebsiella pneumoniae]MCP6663749.1 hypothetical protein [Klebsiella pneumoniae]